MVSQRVEEVFLLDYKFTQIIFAQGANYSAISSQEQIYVMEKK